MGQKVNPIGLRLGITKSWLSNWYAEKSYSALLQEDFAIRDYLRKHLKHAGIAEVQIERAAKNLKVNIYASRPGIIIGRKGEESDKLKKTLVRLTSQKDLTLNIKEVRRPETDAQLIADSIAQQLERRMAFRRVMKKTMQSVMRYNVTGCKLKVSGRLNGAEMSRTEWVMEGQVPLHTLKADINYATSSAQTVYGVIGVKVWIYKDNNAQVVAAPPTAPKRRKPKPASNKKEG